MEPLRIRWTDDDALGERAWRWLAQSFAMPALLATPPRPLFAVALPPSRLSEDAREKLAVLLGASGLRQDDAERARHAAGRGLADLLRQRAGDFSAAPDAVLYPRTEDDVLAVLKLCAGLGIAMVPFGGGNGNVAPARGEFASIVTLDLSGLNRFIDLDMMSGLAEAEAGITGAELARQLAARGMMLDHQPEDFERSTLGGWIAQPGAGRAPTWLHRLQAVTPQCPLTGDADLTQMMLGSRGALGVITRATVRIRVLPAKEGYRGYMFPDFASGLAAVREARRTGLPHTVLYLCDDGGTRFSRALRRAGHRWNIAERLFDAYLSLRGFDGHAAQLLAGFSGSDSEVRAARKRFESIARRLGAMALGRETDWRQQHVAARRDRLLDRGVGMDWLEVPASWSELPALYLTGLAALKQAMRAQVPRPGAHGLAFARIGPAWPEGAMLTFTWVFPRKLEDEIAQAESIRSALLAATGRGTEDLKRDVLRAIKQALDPKGIMNPAN